MDVQPVRVIVRLPYNRPEHPQSDPVPVSWNSDKENYLWEVVAKSRGSEGGAPDWKVLAARLEVPLPYLLYRAQVRYEHDLRGLQVIKGSLSPHGAHDGPPNAETPVDDTGNLPSFPRRITGAGRRDSLSKLSTSIRLTAPLGVRARLNSLSSNSPIRANRPSSSSVLTLRSHRRDQTTFQPSSPVSSESETDGEYERREEAERRLEEQEALDKKLKTLQTLLTGDNVGLVSSVGEHGKGKEPQTQGRFAPSPPPQRVRMDSVSSRSQSISSASSPRGSIPSMPSPPPERPSTTAPLNQAKAQPLMRYGPTVNATAGSSASSFSDLSEASLNSELESAFSSNIRGGGSRFFPFSPSHLIGRGSGRM
ncbi:hypothetical protein DFH94DRAFT_715712 [Russula ochroleuca]|uniref:Autophagy-related protein 29 n=1 Tax=Russula ochroleuca TaxID=152965 RepID=A0A9P5N2V2_9AGAM|nr:hypothetical protein DFH94DRAFT_715712 [Russula ochroleuca]